MKKSKRIAEVLLSAVMATSIISAFPASASTLENETSSVTYNWEDQIISGDYQYINLKIELQKSQAISEKNLLLGEVFMK